VCGIWELDERRGYVKQVVSAGHDGLDVTAGLGRSLFRVRGSVRMEEWVMGQ
jgi:hypothetical protein